jgi:hypothetical protein
MPSQQYRGHVIDVTCSVTDEWIAYRRNIQEETSGLLRYTQTSALETYPSISEAQNQAFTDARDWIERYPLH